MNYPIFRNSRNKNLLQASHSSYSDEYADRMCDLYLSDEIHNNENGRLTKYYRLHAKEFHNREMALAYDIKCPNCGGDLKQVGRTVDCNTLGLYICKTCGKQ